MRRTLFASTLLVAISGVLVAACQPIAGVDSTAAAEVQWVTTSATYFGVEYAIVQQNLPAGSAPAAPTF